MRCIAVSISVYVTRDEGCGLGQEAANRPLHPNMHSFDAFLVVRHAREAR